MADAAMAIGLALALSNLRLFELPNGGSISLSSAPLLVLAFTRGVRIGVLSALGAGFIHALTAGTIIHPVQLFLDYGVASAALGIVGLFTWRSLRLGITVAALIQYACMVISGVWFFGGGAAPDVVWAYSMIYNATTMIPELLLLLVAVPVMVRAACRTDRSLARSVGMVVAGATPRPRRVADMQGIRPSTETSSPSAPPVVASPTHSRDAAQLTLRRPPPFLMEATSPD